MNRIPRCGLALFRTCALVVAATLVAGCEQPPPDPNELANASVIGPAGVGGDVAAGAAWQTALEAWPREGNMAVLYGEPQVQGQMDAWTMGQVPPSPVPPAGVEVMNLVRTFNDRLIELDGGWGPLPDSAAIRGMAVRGIRKNLWADARLAVAEGDVDRLVAVLEVMAVAPRVSHVYDSTVAGLLMTIGLVDGFTWAMGDALAPGFDIELDDAQKSRVREAAAWLETEGAFGVASPEDVRRANVLNEYESKSRARAREMLGRLCG